MYELSPSILSADFNCLGEQLSLLKREGCRWVHIDVMDGMFAPSISYGMPVIQSIRKNSRLFFDIHMMVEEPGRYVQAMKESGTRGGLHPSGPDPVGHPGSGHESGSGPESGHPAGSHPVCV